MLLRDAFLKLGSFPEPISVTTEGLHRVGVMGADAGGAIVLFLAAGLFARMQRHTPITTDQADGRSFRALKSVLVSGLLLVLGALCGYRLLALVGPFNAPPVLDTYFTVLVFVDVLLAFTSLAFTQTPAIVFRNFGFAFSAILLRLAVASPEFIRPSLGLAGAVAAIAVTFAYNISTDQTGEQPAVDPDVDSEADSKGDPDKDTTDDNHPS